MVCWTNTPHKIARAEHNKKGTVDIIFLKKILESSKLSGASIYPMTDIETDY